MKKMRSVKSIQSSITRATGAIFAIAVLASAVGAPVGGQQKTTVVFVCEHGAARSVIAAAYFNKFAAERHLPYRAIARGVLPQEDLSTAAVKGLEGDGVPFDRDKPKPLTEADVKNAARVVAFCPIPTAFSRMVGVDEHEDVPDVSKDYAAARDKLVAYVNDLILQLDVR
jgi:arsenate reductase (thioredoxin)